MEANVKEIDKCIQEYLSAKGTLAFYKGESVSDALEEAGKHFKKTVTEGIGKATMEAIQLEIRMKSAKGISAADVVENHKRFSESIMNFGENLSNANEQITASIKNSFSMEKGLQRAELTQQATLDKFKISNTTSPTIDNGSEANKGKVLGI